MCVPAQSSLLSVGPMEQAWSHLCSQLITGDGDRSLLWLGTTKQPLPSTAMALSTEPRDEYQTESAFVCD